MRAYTRYSLVMALMFLDTETTGLDKDENRIIQLYAYVPKYKAAFEVVMNPGDSVIQDEALAINGRTREGLMAEPITQREGLIKFIKFIRQHYNGRVNLCAHNAPFDNGFVQAWFAREEKEYREYCHYIWQDTMSVAAFLRQRGVIRPRSLKLTDLLSFFGMTLENAHDAGADVHGLVALYQKMWDMTTPLIGSY